MVRGDAVIVQAALQDGHWSGRADVLRRVEIPSGLGAWPSVVEDKKQALDLVDRVLSKNPASASAHRTKGAILLFGHPEEAMAEYDAALEIDPNNPAVYAAKTITLIVTGRAREAFSPLQLAHCYVCFGHCARVAEARCSIRTQGAGLRRVALLARSRT